MNKIRVFNFQGSHRDIGRQQGEEFKHSILEFIGELKENAHLRIKYKLTEKNLQNWLRKDYAYCLEYAPELGDEVVGLAEGANVDPLDIIFLNAFLDIVNARDDKTAANLLGCTSFAVSPENTIDSKTYIGQNYDMESFYNKHKVIIRLKLPEEPQTLIYTYMGILGCIGMNSDGGGLCINFLHSRDSSFGSLYPFRVRKILQQSRLGDSIGAATLGIRAGGINYLFGHKSGLIADN